MVLLNTKAMSKNNIYITILTLAFLLALSGSSINTRAKDFVTTDSQPLISLAYVEADRKTVPDPNLFSHLIYAFCEFNDNNDGVIISNPERLLTISDLKMQNPNLKVILGIGGYKKEGFSEMCGDRSKRKKFIAQCKKIINDYNLDGIDLDWEFPGTTAGGHTSSPNDSKNYGTLVKELRKSLGREQWISFYSNNSGGWIDFKLMLPYVNYVNVSGYNLSTPHPGKKLYHQSPLFSSDRCGNWCISKSIARHIEFGVPRQKILLGIPFFGRGETPFPNYVEARSIDNHAYKGTLIWDEKAQAPLYVNEDNQLILGFDNEKSIELKCKFIRETGLAGGFVWNYDADYEDHRLAKTLHLYLLND